MSTGGDEKLLDLARAIADGESLEEHLGGVENTEAALEGMLKIEKLSRILSSGRKDVSVHQDLPFGGRWGRLELKEEIGRGSFGRVFRASDPVLDRDVALKLLHSLSHGSQLSFLAEARRLARIRHPHVLAIHGADVYHGAAGFWSDLLEGESLEARFTRTVAMSWEEKLGIMLQLAQALDAVHRAGITHGDIKASNVTLDREKGAVLMDFGAGHISPTGGESPAEQVTPLSSAPELLFEGLSGPASDIWALGVLFFRIATGGAYPFPAENLHQLRSMLSGPPLLSGLNSTPRAFRKLVSRMLAAEAEGRPGAAEVVALLRQIQKAPARRIRRGLQAALASLLLLVTGGALLQTHLSRRAEKKIRREKKVATEISSLLQDMLSAASPVRKGRETRVLDLLDEASMRLQRRRSLDPSAALALRTTLGRSYLALGETEKAAELLLRPPEDAKIPAEIRFDAELSHVELLEHQGEVKKSIVEAQRIRRRLPPGEEWDIARNRATNLIAGACEKLGQLERAEAEIRTVIDSGVPTSAEMARSQLILGGILCDQSRFEEAEKALKRSEELYLQTSSRVNSNVLSTRVQLATVMAQAGKLKRARADLEELLPISLREYGPESASVAAVKSNLANVCQELGDYDRALQLYEEARRSLAAQAQPDMGKLWVLDGDIANLLKLVGREGEAEKRYLRLIHDISARLGPAHPMTLLNRFNLSELYNETGQNEKARKLIDAALPVARETLGEKHQITMELEEGLARNLVASGRPAEGLRILRELLVRKTEVLGAGNPYTLNTLVRIGKALEKLGRESEALRSYRKALDGRKKVLGVGHPETRKLEERLRESGR